MHKDNNKIPQPFTLHLHPLRRKALFKKIKESVVPNGATEGTGSVDKVQTGKNSHN